MEETREPTRCEKKKALRRKRRWIIGILSAVTVLAGAAVWYFGFFQAYSQAENRMPQNGAMTLERQEDGTSILTWSVGWNVDYYTVELLTTQEEPETLFSGQVTDGESCVLPAFPSDQELLLRVQPVKEYRTWFGDKIRLGDRPLEYRGLFPQAVVRDISWQTDLEDKRVDIRYVLEEGARLKILLSKNGGQEEWPQLLETEQVSYAFGEDGDYPVPTHGERYDFLFRPYFQWGSLTYYSAETKAFTVTREDFLGTALKLNCQDQGHNQYELTWNETKGEHYEVQRRAGNEEEWTTIARIPADGARVYNTGHLERYSDIIFRVVAVGGQTLPDSEFAAVSAEASVHTQASLIFTTVWPIQDLTVYTDPERSGVLGTAPEASAYCVLDEVDGMFYVRFEDGYGYIDGNYCMVNLPEYMGSLCSYDITNSYSSLFMVHGYEIPGITARTVSGYENIWLAENEYVVPLLYPTAQKLEQAAFAAAEEGLRLKIYDSYRPQEGSLWVYNHTWYILDREIPENRYYGGGPAPDLPKLPEPEPTQPPETLEGGETVAATEPVPTEPQVMTYRYLMTDNGRFYLGNFITDTDSQHNLGIAMDLTLEWIESGDELSMQTKMHDLSFFSALEKNNSNANWLSSIMRSAGFGGLFSEWWHFQDNDTRNSLGLKNYMKVGVSPECWMADDHGWRYRCADGSYYAGDTVTIGEKEYTFDSNGYLVGEL